MCSIERCFKCDDLLLQNFENQNKKPSFLLGWGQPYWLSLSVIQCQSFLCHLKVCMPLLISD